MAAYLLRRLLYVVPTLLGVTLVVFLAVHFAPGDPALARLGSRATPESLERERERLGLHDPAAVQYLRFLGSLLRGDLGNSIVRQRPVIDEIRERFPATLELSLAAMSFAVVVGVALGVLSAVYQHSAVDYVSMGVALLGVSMPIFWLGLILLVIFSYLFPGWPTGQRVDFLTTPQPITGVYSLDTLLRADFDGFVDVIRHLVLPAIALGTIPLAIIARMTRSAMLEVIGQDFVRTARAKGLSAPSVYLRHAFRNALIPVVTVIGLQFGSLLGGAIITETIFSWPGVGTWILEGIQNRDTYVIQGGVLLVASVFILLNILVDVLYVVIDPRIQYQ
jgi:peptide/nickel transport system permease protein